MAHEFAVAPTSPLSVFRNRSLKALAQTRQLAAWTGVAGILTLGFIPDGVAAYRLAFLALTTLGLATVLGCLEAGIWRLEPEPAVRSQKRSRVRWWWLITVACVVLACGLIAQSWFKPGTTIASGDISLAEGTAWITRLFEPWSWSGSNLGEASQLPLMLPWAEVVGAVRGIGGSAEIAQRVWYSMLYISAGAGALGLGAALGMRPFPSFVLATVYVLNPYVVSQVNANPVFLAGLAPLAILPALLIAVGRRQLRIQWGIVGFACVSPFLGYLFLNPPLVGMILATLLLTPVLAAWIFGLATGRRTLIALLVATPVLVALSMFWIVPAVLHLSIFVSGPLANVDSWSWTQTRATLRNGLWLNNTWGWSHLEYYPYAPAYEQFPASIARFVLPALAFTPLITGTIDRQDTATTQRVRFLRLIVAASAISLFVILLSTGTNPPGNTLFNALYSLPYGWILREPGRFLMLASLCYAVLAGAAVGRLIDARWVNEVRWQARNAASWLRLAVIATRIARPGLRARMSAIRLAGPALRVFKPLVNAAMPATVLAVVLVLGFPMYTGAVVPDQRPLLPSAHVRMPAYWSEMASYVDSLSVDGGLLIMPPDDYYAMPYSWGYYGADSFVVDMFRRPVLVPNVQGGYVPTSQQLMDAVNLTAKSIVARNWHLAAALTSALNTPLILVRGDIQAPYPGRMILPPDEIAGALRESPAFDLVTSIGPLELFESRSPMTVGTNKFATVDASEPDLRLLAALPTGTALVSADAIDGVPAVLQVPPVDQWHSTGQTLNWESTARDDYRHKLADLTTGSELMLDKPKSSISDLAKARVQYEPSPLGDAIRVSLATRPALTNGDFTAGPWGPVANCNAVSANANESKLEAQVLSHAGPDGLPAMQLSAARDSACQSRVLRWHGGPLVIDMMVNRVQGNEPRICLWETGPQECAPLPNVSTSGSWSHYRTSVTPDVGTTSLILFLYADGNASGGVTTIIQYANVQAMEVPSLPAFALISEPRSSNPAPLDLFVAASSFSSAWDGNGPDASKHVLVDGMMNGWLVRPDFAPLVPTYTPARFFYGSLWISLLGAFAVLLYVLLVTVVWRPRTVKSVADLARLPLSLAKAFAERSAK